ncbi:MAG: DUF4034 domain-containing protein [Verrucomicrobiota bacterium]
MPVLTEDPVDEIVSRFRFKTRSLFNKRDFGELEKLAKQIREDKAVFPHGGRKIFGIYSSFEPRRSEPESLWQLHDEIYQQWLEEYPESVTAHVAYANFWVEYAWKARGGGYADTVSDEDWALFYERLAKAQEVLDLASDLSEQDPHWWRVSLQVAMGDGWDADAFDQLVDDGHAYDPTYWGIDTIRAFSLLPRWYGESGDWEAYAESVARLPDGLGDEAYARIVLYTKRYYDNVFRETDASWPQTKRGLDQIIRKYPESLSLLSNAARLACVAGDAQAARKYFNLLNQRYYDRAWESEAEYIDFYRWAFAAKKQRLLK